MHLECGHHCHACLFIFKSSIKIVWIDFFSNILTCKHNSLFHHHKHLPDYCRYSVDVWCLYTILNFYYQFSGKGVKHILTSRCNTIAVYPIWMCMHFLELAKTMLNSHLICLWGNYCIIWKLSLVLFLPYWVYYHLPVSYCLDKVQWYCMRHSVTGYMSFIRPSMAGCRPHMRHSVMGFTNCVRPSLIGYSDFIWHSMMGYTSGIYSGKVGTVTCHPCWATKFEKIYHIYSNARWGVSLKFVAQICAVILNW